MSFRITTAQRQLLEGIAGGGKLHLGPGTVHLHTPGGDARPIMRPTFYTCYLTHRLLEWSNRAKAWLLTDSGREALATSKTVVPTEDKP